MSALYTVVIPCSSEMGFQRRSYPTWPRGQTFRPCSIRPRPCSRSRAMLASFSRRLS